MLERWRHLSDGARSRQGRSREFVLPRQWRSLRVLDVPAGFGDRRCRLLDLTPGSGRLAEVPAGGLELVYEGMVARGDAFRVYLESDRRAAEDRRNVWMQTLAGRLGVPIRWFAEWRCCGDALVTGVSDSYADASVPDSVLEAAWRGGLFDMDTMRRAGVTPFEEAPGERPSQLRVPVEVVLLSGRAHEVVISIRDESTVTLESGPNQVVTLDRAALRLWLTRPIDRLPEDSSMGFCVLHERGLAPKIAVFLPAAPVWALPPRVVALLRERV